MSSPRSGDPRAVPRLSLGNPVRLVWLPFLPGDPVPPPEIAAGMAAGIAEAAPLCVEAWVPAPWPGLPPLPFAHLALHAPPEVLATQPEGASRIADLTPYGGEVPTLPRGTATAAFLLTGATARHFPAAVKAALGAGATGLSLPPLPFPLAGRLGAPLGSPSELDALWSGAVAPVLDSLRRLRLEVHDRFLLARLRDAGLPVGAPPEDAGCQAGTALAFVDPAGVVHPCPVWPHPFGTLPGSWDAIWRGEARRLFLGRFPHHVACDACPRWGSCLGGCPGAAAALGLSGVPDPLCPEVPRD